MVESPEKIWAIEKGYPSRYRVSCSVLEHGPDEATEYVRADLYAALEAKLAEREAENERQASDIAEFMRRLGPRWFLEQGWFPKSVGAREDDARRALTGGRDDA